MTDSYRPLVMIADDHGDTRETYAGYLTRIGYNVVECAEATACVELVRRFRPDVIVLVLRVGGTTGVEITEALRGDPALAAIPVLAVTSSPSDQWDTARFSRTLMRPCDPEELAAVLAQIVPSECNRSLL